MSLKHLSIFLASLLAFSSPSFACREDVTEEGQVAHAAKSRIEITKKISEAAKQADSIFIGRVFDINTEKNEKGRVEVKTFKIDILEVLKGSPEKNTTLTYETPLDEILFSCSEAGRFNEVEMFPTNRYIIYEKSGHVLHATHVVDWPNGVPWNEELELVKKQLGI